jgi:pimeloyl-ACP methyl ester carboxylesterase
MPATDIRTVTAWREHVQPRVHIAGDGPPLVFLHGATGLAWTPFLDILAARFTVYAPEHPGTTPGAPEAIDGIDNLWDLVLYYYELFDALGLRSPALVGHSFGGMVAAEVAATNPERVSKLALISPIGLWRDDMPIANWMIMTPDEMASAVLADPKGALAAQLFGASADPSEAAEATIAMMWSLACTGKFVWPIPDKGLKKRLHRISAPTLVVWGQRDALVNPAYAEEFRSRIANARVEVLEGAGHLPQLEVPQRAAEAITNFLA